MRNVKIVLLMVMLVAASSAMAQFKQDKPKVEYMLKVEAGYLHNMGNYGQQKVVSDGSTNPEFSNGYNLRDNEEAFGLNVINGINISQDFFLGFGLGYNYCLPLYQGNKGVSASHMAQGFIDMDYRPINATFAPMVGARLGGSFLMNNNNYGNTITEYVELYAGLNWFYDHAYQQMDRNYHSLYIEAGVVLVQQTVFIPIRIGWRL